MNRLCFVSTLIRHHSGADLLLNTSQSWSSIFLVLQWAPCLAYPSICQSDMFLPAELSFWTWIPCKQGRTDLKGLNRDHRPACFRCRSTFQWLAQHQLVAKDNTSLSMTHWFLLAAIWVERQCWNSLSWCRQIRGGHLICVTQAQGRSH